MSFVYFGKPKLIEPTGLEAQQISKRVNKAALSFVEQTVTLHIVLFYA